MIMFIAITVIAINIFELDMTDESKEEISATEQMVIEAKEDYEYIVEEVEELYEEVEESASAYAAFMLFEYADFDGEYMYLDLSTVEADGLDYDLLVEGITVLGGTILDLNDNVLIIE